MVTQNPEGPFGKLGSTVEIRRNHSEFPAPSAGRLLTDSIFLPVSLNTMPFGEIGLKRG